MRDNPYKDLPPAHFLYAETFEARILSYTKQKKEDTKHRVFLFGSGKRIRPSAALRLQTVRSGHPTLRVRYRPRAFG